MSGDEECETMARLQSRVSREPTADDTHSRVCTAAPGHDGRDTDAAQVSVSRGNWTKTWHVCPRDASPREAWSCVLAETWVGLEAITQREIPQGHYSPQEAWSCVLAETWVDLEAITQRDVSERENAAP